MIKLQKDASLLTANKISSVFFNGPFNGYIFTIYSICLVKVTKVKSSILDLFRFMLLSN